MGTPNQERNSIRDTLVYLSTSYLDCHDRRPHPFLIQITRGGTQQKENPIPRLAMKERRVSSIVLRYVCSTRNSPYHRDIEHLATSCNSMKHEHSRHRHEHQHKTSDCRNLHFNRPFQKAEKVCHSSQHEIPLSFRLRACAESSPARRIRSLFMLQGRSLLLISCLLAWQACSVFPS